MTFDVCYRGSTPTIRLHKETIVASSFLSNKRGPSGNAGKQSAPVAPVKKTSTLVTKPGAGSVPCGPCAAKRKGIK